MRVHSVCGCKITHNLQPDKIFRLKKSVKIYFSVVYNLLPQENKSFLMFISHEMIDKRTFRLQN